MDDSYIKSYKLILSELEDALSSVSQKDVMKLIDAIIRSKKIYVIGAGRMGIMISAFCMRLYQLGFNALIVGSITCPPISSQDLLLIGSSSGETPSILVIAKEGKKYGARVFTITANPDSTIGKLSDNFLYLKGPSSVENSKRNIIFSKQPMKALFEQSLLILLDSIILQLMEVKNQTADDMAKRHTNLE